MDSITKIEHQPRERAVPCQKCRKVDTWNVSAICDRCTRTAEKDCPVCKGDRIVEEPVFGRFAVEATRPIHCPRCWDGKPVRGAA